MVILTFCHVIGVNTRKSFLYELSHHFEKKDIQKDILVGKPKFLVNNRVGNL